MCKTPKICPTCGNKKPLTRHHIYPCQWYHGAGPTYKLCRDCHSELERYIPHKWVLTTRECMDIFQSFINLKKAVLKCQNF